jgi:hypothetical protein
MPLIGTIASDASSPTPANHLVNVSSVPLTVNTTIAAGKTIIGTIVVENGAGANPTITVTDTHSNSYSVDKQVNDNPTNTSATTIFSCRVTTQINSGDTITISSGGVSRSRWAVSVQAFDDILNPRLDQTASNTGVSATVNSGTTPTTTAANELIYAGFGSGVRTFTPGSGFAAATTMSTTVGSTDRSLNAEWKYIAATGTQTATGTLSSSSAFTGAIATYKSSSGNVGPTANAGPDQNVTVSTLVTLDGSGSSDPDGTIAGYAWTQISGTAVTLSDATAQKPTFTAPGSTATLVFGLTVTDNLGATSAQDTVTINVLNKVGYVAQAAAGTSTTSGTSIGPITFSKSVAAGHTLLIGITVDCPAVPPESDAPAVFSATDTKGNTYTANAIGYRAATTSTGIISAYITNALSTSDTITISATTSRGRWAFSAAEFDNIHQNGFDVAANNNAATTTSLVSGTTATTQNQVEVVFAAFSFAHSTSQTFTAGAHYALAGTQQDTGNAAGQRSVANEYRIFTAATTHQATGTLSSTSGYSGAIATYAADLIMDQAPVANAGSPQTVAAFAVVTLNGTGSTDEDGFATSYSWSQTAGPAVTLSSATAAQPTFTAPGVDGGTSLTFSLVVTDNLGTSSTNSATVTITVNSAENFVAHTGSWVAMQELAANAGTWS